ncbi:hypothetical protein [Parendozoicomonas haliclonae]|uniref:hypothetical protein n=1 Tax=Parendozoicomonas haliclonae TaxID=1960125 RepID=UPI001054DBB6
MEKTTFSCLTKNCQWEGSFKQLEIHKKLCQETKENCSFGCGEEFPRFQMDHHQKECRKRPCKEGNLEADCETISEVKQLTDKCLDALKKPSSERALDKHFYDRLITLFPLVTKAALKQHEPTTQPAGAAFQRECEYQCGFIAGTLQELSSHDCPNIPLQCRHCNKCFPAKEINAHKQKCDERMVSCKACGVDTKQGLLTLHYQTCIMLPVECTQCLRSVPQKELAKHQHLECLSRSVNCERCFKSVVFSKLEEHKQNCWLTKPITLREGKPDSILLTPQPDTIGPFYQNGNNSSTIYMVTTHEQLKPLFKLNRQSVFSEEMDMICIYHGKPATIKESYYTSDTLNWIIHLSQTTPEKVICSRADVLDADLNIICSFHPYHYPKLSDIMVNSDDANRSKAALDSDKISRVQHCSHPNPLRIIRFMPSPGPNS